MHKIKLDKTMKDVEQHIVLNVPLMFTAVITD